MCHSSGNLPRVRLIPPEYKRRLHPKQAAAHLVLTEAKTVSDIAPTTGSCLPKPTSTIPNIPAEWKMAKVFRARKCCICECSVKAAEMGPLGAHAAWRRPSTEPSVPGVSLQLCLSFQAQREEVCGGASMFTALIHSERRRVSPAAEIPQRKIEWDQSQGLASSYCANWEIEKSCIHFCLNEVNAPPTKVTHLPPGRFMHSKAPGFQFNMKRIDLTPNISLQFIPGASFAVSVLN